MKDMDWLEPHDQVVSHLESDKLPTTTELSNGVAYIEDSISDVANTRQTEYVEDSAPFQNERIVRKTFDPGGFSRARKQVQRDIRKLSKEIEVEKNKLVVHNDERRCYCRKCKEVLWECSRCRCFGEYCGHLNDLTSNIMDYVLNYNLKDYE